MLQDSSSAQSYLDKLFFDYFSAKSELGNFTLDIHNQTMRQRLSLAMSFKPGRSCF
jgi:hypothetical protein